jgi:hypothetical protein
MMPVGISRPVIIVYAVDDGGTQDDRSRPQYEPFHGLPVGPGRRHGKTNQKQNCRRDDNYFIHFVLHPGIDTKHVKICFSVIYRHREIKKVQKNKIIFK